MNRTRLLVRLALSMLVANALTMSVARAGVPDPSNYIIPDAIRLVGHNGGSVGDPQGRFTILVRDLALTPIPDASVVIDFTAATDLRLCVDPGLPGMVVDCATHTVTATTNALGIAEFLILGRAQNPGGVPGPETRVVRVWVDGIFAKLIGASAFDLTGNDGVGAPDIGAFLSDFASGFSFTRSDYDGSGTLNVLDFVELLKTLGVGASTAGCTTTVPAGSCP